MHRLTALSLAALMLGAPASVGSHPHVWVTGGAHFGMDAEGRLERLYINWTYDTYASLYLLSYVKADEDGDQVLNEEDKKRIIADQTNWPDDFAGDSYLFVAGKKQKMGKPVNPDTRILPSGQVEVTFERLLEAPFRPEADKADVFVKLYDPAFYYSYEVTEPPEVRGEDGHGCTASHKPYDENDPALKALQVELSQLGKEETPDQQDVGALFADELRLTCE